MYGFDYLKGTCGCGLVIRKMRRGNHSFFNSIATVFFCMELLRNSFATLCNFSTREILFAYTWCYHPWVSFRTLQRNKSKRFPEEIFPNRNQCGDGSNA